MRYIGFIILLILVVLGISFAVLNSDKVAINYYFATAHLSLSLLLALDFAIGVLLAVCVMMFKLIGLSMENSRLRRKLRKLEQQQV